jgi:hypothetical protein
MIVSIRLSQHRLDHDPSRLNSSSPLFFLQNALAIKKMPQIENNISWIIGKLLTKQALFLVFHNVQQIVTPQITTGALWSLVKDGAQAPTKSKISSGGLPRLKADYHLPNQFGQVALKN